MEITLINGLAMMVAGVIREKYAPDSAYTMMKQGLALTREAYGALEPTLDETTRMIVLEAVYDARLVVKRLEKGRSPALPNLDAVTIPVPRDPSCARGIHIHVY